MSIVRDMYLREWKEKLPATSPQAKQWYELFDKEVAQDRTASFPYYKDKGFGMPNDKRDDTTRVQKDDVSVAAISSEAVEQMDVNRAMQAGAAVPIPTNPFNAYTLGYEHGAKSRLASISKLTGAEVETLYTIAENLRALNMPLNANALKNIADRG